ncbi:cupin domain-containing protein [Cryptosporangium aurantiacum]|uniref:Cupin domain-containing protein n=1 Tax=Cryptosporangium aurantiacum TaxID=134849 RepID=A0A1M7RPK2_9ACTN|nr:cupin domain-containing protein [Cryptosporangium aurantiacum]SHN48100.1 Cupin domain-containing protein [Cryptosporangium aurantiacum]
MNRLDRDLPVFEFYTDRASGARLELHPWFSAGGRQYLGFTRLLPPRTGRAPAHVHPGVEQRSLLLDGTAARYRRSGRGGLLRPGDDVVIPPGVRHTDPYNHTDEPIVVRSLFSPGPVSLLSHSRTLGRAIRDGNVNDQQELPLPHLLAVLAQPGSVTFAAGLPVGLQRRVLLPLAAAVARRKGYRPAPGLRRAR